MQIQLWRQIQTGGADFGVRGNQFEFNIAGNSNLTAVVEATTSLANPVWQPLETITLSNGVFNFVEPLQTNGSGRFYRLSPP